MCLGYIAGSLVDQCLCRMEGSKLGFASRNVPKLQTAHGLAACKMLASRLEQLRGFGCQRSQPSRRISPMKAVRSR